MDLAKSSALNLLTCLVFLAACDGGVADRAHRPDAGNHSPYPDAGSGDEGTPSEDAGESATTDPPPPDPEPEPVEPSRWAHLLSAGEFSQRVVDGLGADATGAIRALSTLSGNRRYQRRITKLSPDGELEWEWALPELSKIRTNLEVLPDGRALLAVDTGTARTTFSIAEDEPYHAALFEIGDDGITLGVHDLNESGPFLIHGFHALPDGTALLIADATDRWSVGELSLEKEGEFTVQLHLSSTLAPLSAHVVDWPETVQGKAVYRNIGPTAADPDGGFVAVLWVGEVPPPGSVDPYWPGHEEALYGRLVVRVAPDGSLQWVTPLGIKPDREGSAPVVKYVGFGKDENVVVGGQGFSTFDWAGQRYELSWDDWFFATLDADGSPKGLHGFKTQHITDMHFERDGSVYLSGQQAFFVGSPTPYGGGEYLARLDASGNLEWIHWLAAATPWNASFHLNHLLCVGDGLIAGGTTRPGTHSFGIGKTFKVTNDDGSVLRLPR